MEEAIKELLNKDELIKSLKDLDFSEEDIAAVIEKGEKEGKFEAPEKDEDGETVDEVKDKEEMKKAYDKVMSMKDELDKAMDSFLDKFGKVAGFSTPTDFVKKSEETEVEKGEETEITKTEEDIKKAEVLDIEKAFGDKFESISKSFETQNKVNEELIKSLTKINETVEQIANTPNPFKGLFGNYKGSILEKGEKTNEDGKPVFNLKHKEIVVEQFEKAIDSVENEKDKQKIRDMISDYTISGKTNDAGLNIVKKALQIDFEK